MDSPTLIEGGMLVLAVLCLSPLYAWFWREKTEPEPKATQWCAVFTQRAGHTFVVIYHDDQVSEAITALGNIAVHQSTPMNISDAERLADAMENRG